MLSYLVPNKCTVKIALRTPRKEDFELMEAQLDTISSMDMNTNQFILPTILEEVRRVCKIENGDGEFLVVTPEELQSVLDANSIESVLGTERTSDLFNILFSAEIDNGFLKCINCNEEYAITNNIVDFVQKDEEQ